MPKTCALFPVLQLFFILVEITDYIALYMKFEAITIKDIAKALDLSPSTVSRALRDSYEIGEDTKKRVKNYAKQHNYRPNPAALSLKEKKTLSIGVVVSEIANPFFSQIIDGIESIAYDKGYNVIITQSKESVEREKIILDYLTSRSVDGLIISVSAETNNSQELIELKERGLPLVFVDRIAENIETHKVTTDNFKGAFDATQHLIKNGYHKIAVIANNQNLSITKDRLSGYLSASEENKMVVFDDLIFYCEHGATDADEVEKALTSLFERKQKPDAILALSDKISTQILRYCVKNKIKIPEDVAVIGFSNSPDTELMHPPLSIIYQPALEMGEAAAEFLFQMIGSKRPTTSFETKVLTPKIITRESSIRSAP